MQQVGPKVDWIRPRARALLANARPVQWGLFVSALYLVVSLAVYERSPNAHKPISDGFYSWIYARSIAFDGDVDFANDYALCGNPLQMGTVNRTGRANNIFYVGPAVVWTPVLWILRHTTNLRAEADSVRGACTGPLVRATLATSSFVGAFATFLSYALARRFVSDGIAAAAAFVATMGGQLIYFTTSYGSYSHAYDALAVAGLLVCCGKALDRPESIARWLGSGVLLGLAVLQRPSNVIWALVPVSVAWLCFRGQWGRATRVGLVVAVSSLTVGVLPMLLIYRAIFGRYVVFTHGPHFLHMLHAHPLLLLFDTRGGLFFYAPALWLTLGGLLPAFRRRAETGWLFVPCALIAFAELWISSAALDWQGARRLTNLTALYALLIALGFDMALRWLRARPERLYPAFAASVTAPCVFTALGTSWTFGQGNIPYDNPLSQDVLYARINESIWAPTTERIGTLSILPAEWLFAWRYGLEHEAFASAAHPRWYARNFESLAYEANEIPMSDHALINLLSGMHREDDGAHLDQKRTRLVFAAQWPFVTNIELRLAAGPGTSIVVSRAGFFGRPVVWGTITNHDAAADTAVMYPLEVPKGAFDSGINEIVFEVTEGEPHAVRLESLKLFDRNH